MVRWAAWRTKLFEKISTKKNIYLLIKKENLEFLDEVERDI